MIDSATTGAASLIRTLTDAGIDHCFANPGTSEMSLVQAIDANSSMRPVLCLFEGVCTGAADGFARAAGTPAATLLHLGPGFANGIANLHNARRAATPIINLIGEHASWHKPLDAPLSSDIESLARACSCWVRTASSADALARDGAEAITAAHTRNPGSLGQIATLIIPANTAWEESRAASVTPHLAPVPMVSDLAIAESARALNSNSLLLLGGNALTAKGLRAADAISKAKGCRFACVTFPPRIVLGPDLPQVARMPYFPEHVQSFLQDVTTLILVGADAPISFFAYQNVASDLTPKNASVYRLAHQHEDATAALAALAKQLKARDNHRQQQQRPPLPEGELSARAIAQSLAAQMPEQGIFSVDSGGGGAAFYPIQSAAPVLWLNLTGGSIGQGGPASTGAALACPGRRVVALLGDGGAMYTIQCLWTQARENLDVTTIVFNNSSYQILVTEYQRMGINTIGDKAASMFDLGNPVIDWAQIAAGMGVPGVKVRSAEEFNKALAQSLAAPGPMLIDAVLA